MCAASLAFCASSLLLRVNSFPFLLSVVGLHFCALCLPQNQFAALNVPKKDNSQIEGPSIANSYGFKISMQNLQDAKALHEVSCSTFILLSCVGTPEVEQLVKETAAACV